MRRPHRLPTPYTMSFVKCRLLVPFGAFTVACTAPTASGPETGYTPSEYHSLSSASSEYERNVAARGVYEGVYENKAAIRHYCGNGEGVTDVPSWLAACERTLQRVYWARVKTQYQYANWEEVTDYCDLKPIECSTPKGLDGAIRSSHISGAQRRNYEQANLIEAEKAARIEAEQAAHEQFVKTLSCAPLLEADRAECLGQRVVRCKAQLSVMATTTGARGSSEGYCIETPAQEPGPTP